VQVELVWAVMVVLLQQMVPILFFHQSLALVVVLVQVNTLALI
jgi:hypothetical protein